MCIITMQRNKASFRSRDQLLCKFIGTKESVYIRKEFNSHKTGLEHQHGLRFIVFIVFFFIMVSVTSYENALYKTNYHTIQHNTIQFNTVKYNAIQYTTLQCNVTQYNTKH